MICESSSSYMTSCWIIALFVLGPRRSFRAKLEGSPPSSHGSNPLEFVQLFGPNIANLQHRPTGDGARDRRLVGVFELSAYRQAGRDPRNSNPEGLDDPGDVHRGR